LKKRTKKLLDVGYAVGNVPGTGGKSFLVLFFKKELLPFSAAWAAAHPDRADRLAA
jgi:hypothetical protein